ncbi:MAG TPA: NAD(+) synthase, partial [Nitrososphaerales archaeon]|nr:NAD(+) synthase [Nitrososphaerales archaeon]
MDSDPLKISPARETRRVTRFIQRVVSSSRSNGAVLGLSGGVDSAVTGALCVRALGKKSVVVALMNSRHTPMADVEDAEALAKSWGVRVVRAEISKIVDSFEDGLGSEGGRIASANLQARVRMTILYYHANSMGLLVADRGQERGGDRVLHQVRRRRGRFPAHRPPVQDPGEGTGDLPWDPPEDRREAAFPAAVDRAHGQGGAPGRLSCH